ncbi:PTS sugar transporter subunit IIB, partial [Thomasclavelia ramosa]
MSSMSEIKLIRIDFRLMHGQVVTNWIKQVS